MKVSVIVPVYNEEGCVAELVGQLKPVLEQQGVDFEILLIDDGSRDGTFSIVEALSSADARVRGVQFRRNHGQTAALMAGFDFAEGDVCITMDGDLQHSPEHIPEFLTTLQEGGYDLVCSYRYQRNDAFIRRFPSKIANLIARKISNLALQDFGSTYRAYRTEVVKDIPVYGEMHRFIPIFISLKTHRITEIPIRLKPRVQGRSKYGISRTFRVFSDLWTLMFFSGFFNRPMHLFGYLALLIGIPGILALTGLIIAKLFAGISIMDYSPMFFLGILSTLFAGQLMTTGVVCEYLIRIYYSDDKRKPYSVGKTTFDNDAQTTRR